MWAYSQSIVYVLEVSWMIQTGKGACQSCPLYCCSKVGEDECFHKQAFSYYYSLIWSACLGSQKVKLCYFWVITYIRISPVAGCLAHSIFFISSGFNHPSKYRLIEFTTLMVMENILSFRKILKLSPKVLWTVCNYPKARKCSLLEDTKQNPTCSLLLCLRRRWGPSAVIKNLFIVINFLFTRTRMQF